MKKSMMALLILIMCFFVCSCGGDKPDGTVLAFCDAMKEFDYVEMMKYVVSDKDDADDNTNAETNKVVECLKPYAAQTRYVIEKSVIDGDAATVTVKFDYPDIAPIIPEVMPDFFVQALPLSFEGASEEKMIEIFGTVLQEKLDGFKADMTSGTVEFKCCKTEDGWMIAEMPEITDILICNMNKGYENMQMEMES